MRAELIAVELVRRKNVRYGNSETPDQFITSMRLVFTSGEKNYIAEFDARDTAAILEEAGRGLRQEQHE